MLVYVSKDFKDFLWTDIRLITKKNIDAIEMNLFEFSHNIKRFTTNTKFETRILFIVLWVIIIIKMLYLLPYANFCLGSMPPNAFYWSMLWQGLDANLLFRLLLPILLLILIVAVTYLLFSNAWFLFWSKTGQFSNLKKIWRTTSWKRNQQM